jgi:hypothetical protein
MFDQAGSTEFARLLGVVWVVLLVGDCYKLIAFLVRVAHLHVEDL